jgi:hypothetical protein
MPTIGGCLFFGCHGSALLFFVWLTYRLKQTYEAHSGFCFRGSLLWKLGLSNADAAAYHDFHHTGNSVSSVERPIATPSPSGSHHTTR